MKLTPRRPRSDSAKAAIAAAQSAALGPLKPPRHVTLRKGDRPFWNAIVTARPRDTWTDADLVLAASLARAYFDIETLQAQLDADGLILDGKPHPALAILETMMRRALATGRQLKVDTISVVGKAESIHNGAELERKAREDAEDDDLIPGLRAIK